ncbi:hypothetical protein TWF594_000741 [Orbilia oligospora]|nr:hypothetical protein TWF594_000741 [Orbilia oligospora]
MGWVITPSPDSNSKRKDDGGRSHQITPPRLNFQLPPFGVETFEIKVRSFDGTIHTGSILVRGPMPLPSEISRGGYYKMDRYRLETYVRQNSPRGKE